MRRAPRIGARITEGEGISKNSHSLPEGGPLANALGVSLFLGPGEDPVNAKRPATFWPKPVREGQLEGVIEVIFVQRGFQAVWRSSSRHGLSLGTSQWPECLQFRDQVDLDQ